ncbi:phage tail sheath C-terminal domain-containing protein [Sphingomonas sp.]|uniref:phage tail sheath C-terminal domain-containing protein n=1 Tax=Sphingomonas sp. TaxID=28214 RepID=UPI0031DD9E04
MSFVPSFPGVYIREVPSGSRSIAGASTSIAAFVGSFARGPTDSPVRLFSLADFETHFGGIAGDHPASFAVSQFFVNGGGTAYAVRVANGADAASVTMQDWAAAGPVLRATAGRMIGDRAVANPGAWGNALRIDIDYRTADPATQFNLVVSEVRLQDGIAQAVRTEVFRNLTMTPGPNNAIAVVNAGSALITLDRDAGWGTDRPGPTGFYSDDLAAAPPDLTQLTGQGEIDIDFGTGAQTIAVDYGAGSPATLAAAAATLQDAIRAAQPANRLFAQATVTVEGDRLRVAPGRNAPDYAPGAIVTVADTTGTFAATLLLDPGIGNVEQYFPAAAPVGLIDAATEGDDGNAIDAPTLSGNRGLRTSFYALDNIDAFNMLAIPQAAELGDNALQAGVMAPALAYVIEKRAMLFVDPPPGTDTLEEAEAWLDDIAGAGLRSPNSVAYYPRLRVSDPTDGGRLREVAPSGTMAGVWARTDGESGVWKAPAGTTASLRGVPELTHVLSDPQNGVLNPVGLNALRSFDIPGNVAWGARTLMGADLLASDWKYIPVRRTALFIESSLFDGLQWAVFQPNADPLWLEIRGAVTAFMQRLFRQGAFKGTSPRDAYIVRCGPDTTTQADINAGIVNVFVGFAPLQPAEFVVVSLQLQLQQAA